MLGGIPRQVTLLCAPPWHLALDPTVALSSLKFVIYSTSSILAFFFFKTLIQRVRHYANTSSSAKMCLHSLGLQTNLMRVTDSHSIKKKKTNTHSLQKIVAGFMGALQPNCEQPVRD